MSTEQQRSAWPGGTPRNDTPNTPDLSESELRAMHVDELRKLARRDGVSGANDLRKEQLVDAISALHRQQRERGVSQQARTGRFGRAADRDREARPDAGRGGGDAGEWPGGTPRNDTPNTPDLSESELRAMHVDELRKLARRDGVSGANDLRKEELVDAISALHRSAT